ncbi:polymorphic toxin-type HINT domain-containing protein [Paenibacillus kribbensis]|uniref:polymorphic toxin-type HINT domain-containing protein n=1 Tax=Paenibacillus kribbensis TaxID=172713 RepID=UPI002118A276|nr:polymorphic toxin-type HINT domain-containing protein [Paenibacillus kribbensis]
MFKRYICSLLCVLMLLGPWSTWAYGAEGKGTETASQSSSSSAPQIITRAWLAQQTGKDQTWVNAQLSKGYTLYDIYKAWQKDGGENSLPEQSPSLWVQPNGLELSAKAKTEPSDESADLKVGEKPAQAVQDEETVQQQPKAENEGESTKPSTTEVDVPSVPNVSDSVYTPIPRENGLSGQDLLKQSLLQMSATLAVYAPLDQTALAQSRLSDDTSRYGLDYGDNSVSTASGQLVVQNTDLVLPGSLPFVLTRVYNSSLANNQIGVQQNDGVYTNTSAIREEEAASGLGRGWKWDLPHMQKQDGKRYLYMPGTGSYELKNDLQLEGYAYKDLKINSDQSASVQGVSSKYKIAVLNGNDYYLDQDGYLILIQDAYKNRVEFDYTSSDGIKRIRSIRNNDSRELDFTYNAGQLAVKEQGTDHQYTYRQSGEGSSKVLSEVLDSLSRSTSYAYTFMDAPFNLVADGEGKAGALQQNTTALLTRIVRPASSITDIRYEAYNKQIGVYGTQGVFKVVSRADMYSTTAGNRFLNKMDFTYSGEDLASYGKNAEWTVVATGTRTTETFHFGKVFRGDNAPDKLVLNRYDQAGDSTGYHIDYTYNDAMGWNLPVQMRETYTESGSSSEPVTTSYDYNEYGLPLKMSQSTGAETVHTYRVSNEPFFWVQPVQTVTKISEGKSLTTVRTYKTEGTLYELKNYEGTDQGKLLSHSYTFYNAKGNMSGRKVLIDNRNYTDVSIDYKSPYGSQLPTRQLLPKGVEYTYDYYPTGEIKSQTDAKRKIKSYVYDALGRVTKVTYPDGTQTVVVYKDDTNDITVTGPDGVSVERLYNPFGQMLQEQVDDAIYGYGYDDNGDIVESTDAEQATTRYAYDAFGRPVKTTYADGTTDTVAYNAVDRTVTQTDASGYRVREVSDALGRETSTQEAKNGSFQPLESLAYNDAGMVISRTDGNGQRMLYDYDALGQMTSVTDPSGQQVSYMYDLAGNLKTVQYPDGQKNVYSYDELGRRTLLEKASGGTTLNIYDTDGNITRTLTGKLQAITFQYNADGLVTEAAGPDFKTNYTYDNAGRRKSMTDGQGTTSYAYDPADGSLTGLKYPDGTQISYEYNKQSRTGYVLTDASGTSMHVQSKLDSLGRVTQMDVSSGTGTANVQSLAGASAASGGSLDSMTFDYAPNGLLKGQASSRGLSTRFSYNGLDLSGVTVEQGGTALHQFGYEHDGNKNIIGRTQNGTTDQFGYDPSNRIASEAAGEKNKTYGYDPNGNRSAEGSGKVFGMESASYGYDSVSRLTNVSGEGKEVGYSYNGDGLLYERTEGGKTTRYYYDEEAKLMAEAEVVGGTAKIMYAYVYDLSGQLWARQDKASGQLQYYQLNGHGDVVGLSDSAGKELNSYSYDIWGGPETVKETVPNVLRYAGEYWDDTTGLQYLRARWYDPGTARFMGEDTYQGEITSPLSLNGYTYVHNNPLTNSDPTGNWCTATVRGKYYSHPGYCSGSGKNADYIPDSISINFGRSIYAAGVKQGTWYPKGAARVKWDKSGISDAVMGCYYDVQCASFVSGSLVEGPAIAKITKGKSASTGKTAKDVISKCNCFTAGTKVQTDEGEKNIEDIMVGDRVLSKDETTGEVAYKEVTTTFNHETNEIYRIYVGDQTIEATYNHPFWVDGKGWTFVKDLQIGDLLVQTDGNSLEIHSIEKLQKRVMVYNITVDDFHTYYVSDIGIWVHNAECSLSAKTLATMGKTSKGIAGLADEYVTKDKVMGIVKEFVGNGYSTGVAKNGYKTYISKDGNLVARYGFKKDGSLELNLENNIGGNFHIKVK